MGKENTGSVDKIKMHIGQTAVVDICRVMRNAVHDIESDNMVHANRNTCLARVGCMSPGLSGGAIASIDRETYYYETMNANVLPCRYPTIRFTMGSRKKRGSPDHGRWCGKRSLSFLAG